MRQAKRYSGGIMRIASAGLLLLLLSGVAGSGADDGKEAQWNVAEPPGKSRDVAIDTRAGTWMSLDVSPDGRTIAFDLLGDIYVLPMEGGEARAINSGLPWSMQPRYSPDGSQIAYTSDAGGGDNIWIMMADGSDPRQLTHEDFRLLNDPRWLPGGDYVAARKHFTTTRSLGTGEIWLYHKGGGDGIALVERPNEKHQKELGEPAFSPDGRYLYYSLDSTPGPLFEYGQDSNGQIFEIRRLDLHTGATDSVVAGPGGAVRPTPSPDGRYLAFVRRIRAKSALFLKDLDKGGVKLLNADLDQDLQEVWAIHGAYPNMSWTPDSKALVFWAGGGIRRIDIDTLALTQIGFHVRDSRRVFDPLRPAVEVAPDVFDSRMARSAEVSPDGTRVVFETAGALYIRDLPDGAPRLLTHDSRDRFEYYPSWSRDGSTIVFVAWDGKALAHVYIVAARGGPRRRLTVEAGHYHEPRFSPDGRTIVFERRKPGRFTSPHAPVDQGVYAIPARGGAARRITRDGTNPQFGAKNDRLFVTRADGLGGGASLVRVDMNGEAPRVLASGSYVSRFSVAPDERHVAFRENHHVYVMPLPPGGKALEAAATGKSVMTVKASANTGNYPHWSQDGARLNWSLGSSIYGADVTTLFVRKGAGGAGPYRPPTDGVSLAVHLKSDAPEGRVALVGARIVTMSRADGGVIEDGVVLVEGNRIRAVGKRADVVVAGDTTVVDVAGMTVIPGIIDAHAHVPRGEHVIAQQNWSLYATLAFGVTTLHDPSSESTEIFAASEMQRTGRILAPRIFSSGNAVYGARSIHFSNVTSLEDAREYVAGLKAQGAMTVKNYNQPRRAQRQQVTVAAREAGMLVASESGSLFHMTLSMVADGNSSMEHNLPQSMLYEDVLQFWSQTAVAYTPTLVVTVGGLRAEQYWYQETDVWAHPLLSRFVPPDVLQPRSVRRLKAPAADFHHFKSAATAKLLADRGVLVSIGAHGQREGLAAHWEIWGFAQGGMSPIKALRCATSNPAKALGYDRDLGSIEVGKLADMAVIDADILSDIFQSDRVSMVMLNGRLYDAATLNEKVTGTRRARPFHWQ